MDKNVYETVSFSKELTFNSKIVGKPTSHHDIQDFINSYTDKRILA